MQLCVFSVKHNYLFVNAATTNINRWLFYLEDIVALRGLSKNIILITTSDKGWGVIDSTQYSNNNGIIKSHAIFVIYFDLYWYYTLIIIGRAYRYQTPPNNYGRVEKKYRKVNSLYVLIYLRLKKQNLAKIFLSNCFKLQIDE